MQTATITRRTELAHRTSDGIDVYLFWNQPGSRVTVSVFDERTNDGFELEVDGRDALDAFNHPFACRTKQHGRPERFERCARRLTPQRRSHTLRRMSE